MSIEAAVDLLAPAPLLRGVVREQVERAVDRFRADRQAFELGRESPRSRKLQQAEDALEKFATISASPEFLEALAAGIGRAMLAGAITPDEVDDALTVGPSGVHKLARLLAIANVRTETDPKEDLPLRYLVMALGLIYKAVTGEGVPYPGYDDARGEPAPHRFLAVVRLCAAEVMTPHTPSDEALRHRIRNAIEFGDIPAAGGTQQNFAASRLYQFDADAANQPVTQTNEVTDGRSTRPPE